MRTTLLTLLVSIGALAVVAAAGADGVGPSPGASTGWTGVRAPGGVLRYVALPGQKETIVAAVRVRGGRVDRWGAVRGAYGIPLVAFDGSADGLSGDGKTLVLTTPTWNPGPVSRFPVLATSNFRLRHTVTLRGAWAYDAISRNGSTLYLVQYLGSGSNPAAPRPYRVRAFDLAAGKLVPGAIVDRRETEAAMRGQPATRIWSQDRRWAYTLYARQGGPPFVHALDTVRQEAFCIDLPLRLAQPRQMGLRFRLGAESLAVTSGRTTVAVVDTSTFAVRKI